ncbi:MAG: hypothetical protein V1652_01635 [bacterium]
MEKKRNQFIYWTPRILSLLFIGFLALMSLDVFDMHLGFLQTLGALFMHNIPALILLVIVLAAWKYEIIGGIAFILAGLLYVVMVFSGSVPWQIAISWSLIIAGPAFLIGALFLVGWFKKRRR